MNIYMSYSIGAFDLTIILQGLLITKGILSPIDVAI